MTAWKKTISLKIRLSTHGIDLSHDEVNTLRRAELTLQRWGESVRVSAYRWHPEPAQRARIASVRMEGEHQLAWVV